MNGPIFLALISLNAPDGHPIWLNPNDIIELHDARPQHAEHFAAGTKCLIEMSSGKTVAVGETCDAVLQKAHPP
jgi:uncharacterized protein YlzI (FlbEa/FlbD family)